MWQNLDMSKFNLNGIQIPFVFKLCNLVKTVSSRRFGHFSGTE